MKFWGFNQVAPLLTGEQRFALQSFAYGSSIADQDVDAAVEAGLRSINPEPSPSIALIISIGAPARRFYLRPPTYAEWTSLERGGVLQRTVVDEDGNFSTLNSIMVDAVH